MADMTDVDLEAVRARRAELRAAHLKPPGDRPASIARGLHHTALISSDVERTIRFYQDVVGFSLTELIDAAKKRRRSNGQATQKPAAAKAKPSAAKRKPAAKPKSKTQ